MNEENTAQNADTTVETTDTTEETKEVTPEGSDESTSTDTDYEAIVREEEARKPDPVRAKIAFKEREAKRQVTGEDESDEDAPVTRKDLQAIVERTRQETQKSLTETTASELARNISSSDAEARAILAKWRNRSFPEGVPLSQQIEEMHAAVNYKRFTSERNEAARALKSKTSVSQNAAGTHRDPPPADMPKMSPADLKGLQGAGYKWDGVKRVFKKPLPGGKAMYIRDLNAPSWIE
jgi:hypothetical protein